MIAVAAGTIPIITDMVNLGVMMAGVMITGVTMTGVMMIGVMMIDTITVTETMGTINIIINLTIQGSTTEAITTAMTTGGTIEIATMVDEIVGTKEEEEALIANQEHQITLTQEVAITILHPNESRMTHPLID